VCDKKDHNIEKKKELSIKEEELRKEGLKRRADEFGVTVEILEFLAKGMEKYDNALNELKDY
jgi:hypothetical protein